MKSYKILGICILRAMYWLIMCMALAILSLKAESFDIEEPDKSDWVDPHDMFADPNQAVLKKETDSAKKDLEKCIQELKEAASDQGDWQQYALMYRNMLACVPSKEKKLSPQELQRAFCNTTTSPPVTRMKESDELAGCQRLLEKRVDILTYVVTLVKGLLTQLAPYQQTILMEGEEELSVRLLLSESEYKALEEFVEKPELYFREVFTILKSMSITGAQHTQTTIEWLRENTAVIVVAVQVVFLIVLLSTVRLSWRFLLKIAVFSMCIISYIITYMRMIKHKEAERYAELMKMTRSDSALPSVCTPGSMSTVDALWNMITMPFSFAEDKCAAYFKNQQVNVYLEVSPLEVLSETVTRFFVQPLTYIGTASGLFIKGLFGNLPVHLYLPAFGLLVFVIFLTFVMFSGYQLNLFHLIHVGPSRNQELEAAQYRNNQLTIEVETLSRQLGHLQLTEPCTGQRQILSQSNTAATIDIQSRNTHRALHTLQDTHYISRDTRQNVDTTIPAIHEAHVTSHVEQDIHISRDMKRNVDASTHDARVTTCVTQDTHTAQPMPHAQACVTSESVDNKHAEAVNVFKKAVVIDHQHSTADSTLNISTQIDSMQSDNTHTDTMQSDRSQTNSIQSDNRLTDSIQEENTYTDSKQLDSIHTDSMQRSTLDIKSLNLAKDENAKQVAKFEGETKDQTADAQWDIIDESSVEELKSEH